MDPAKSLKLLKIGKIITRYGLVVILFWIGCLKFTSYEAMGIKGLVANSPFTAWGLNLLGLQGCSNMIGIIEIILALMIAMRYINAKISGYGSLGTIIMGVVTLSFLVSTPGIWQPEYGFPLLSPMPGQFLLKDLLLLGVGFWTAGEAFLAGDIITEDQVVHA